MYVNGSESLLSTMNKDIVLDSVTLHRRKFLFQIRCQTIYFTLDCQMQLCNQRIGEMCRFGAFEFFRGFSQLSRFSKQLFCLNQSHTSTVKLYKTVWCLIFRAERMYIFHMQSQDNWPTCCLVFYEQKFKSLGIRSIWSYHLLCRYSICSCAFRHEVTPVKGLLF